MLLVHPKCLFWPILNCFRCSDRSSNVEITIVVVTSNLFAFFFDRFCTFEIYYYPLQELEGSTAIAILENQEQYYFTILGAPILFSSTKLCRDKDINHISSLNQTLKQIVTDIIF